MKRLICILLVGLLAAGVMGCGQVQTVTPGPWGVTIERVDLSKPENQKYLNWAKRQNKHLTWTSFWRTLKVLPKYYWVEILTKDILKNRRHDPWTHEEDTDILREKHRPWNDTKELVIRETDTNEADYGWEWRIELLVRDKATGETECIDYGSDNGHDGVVFDPIAILSDTRILYHKWHWDGGFNGDRFLYDLAIGERICVSGGHLCDLGNRRYLWGDGNALYLIDLRALEAGKKEAKRELINWGDDYGFTGIKYLSSDKRFVYVQLYRYSDNTLHRGVYDTNSGEQVALFELPLSNDHTPTEHGMSFISDDLECISYGGDDVDALYLIHYNRTGVKP